MNRKPVTKSTIIAVLVTASAIPALAGPPLVCHPLDIGNAKSLPWGSDAASWDQPLANYNLAHLADETLALLTPDTPVIVRMETIRRAAIYARNNPPASKELILKFSGRARDAEAQSKSGALEMFDYGYLIEATKEAAAASHAGQSNVAMHLDGYPWLAEALAASHDDPEMEFAAALIVMGRSDLKTHQEHAQKALDGSRADSLLARNLTIHFIGAGGDTMNTLLAKAAKGN